MTEYRPGRPAPWEEAEEGYAHHGGDGHDGFYGDAGYGDGHDLFDHHGDYDDSHYEDGHYEEDGHPGPDTAGRPDPGAGRRDRGAGGRSGGALPPGYGDPDGWPAVTESGAPSYRRPARDRRRGSGGGRRLRHPVLTTLAAFVVLVLLLVAGGLLWAQGQINPGGKRGPAVSVVIPKGATTSQIGHVLASAGIIHNGTLFAYYVRLHGDGPLYPGTYSLPKNSPYSAAVAALEAGPKILTDNLVIPEGYTLRQIADAVGALPHLGLSASKFLADATQGTVRSPYEPPGVNSLEGLLFPATYQVRQGETDVDLLEQMIGAFNERAAELGLTAAASRLGYTPYQIVTVASIVERESKLAGDRGPVASTIYNRLKIGMKLGADSTQTYYLRQTDPTIQPTPAQLDTPSPYNTRTDKGLPPTPIANPGLDSLRAAISPPSTTYLYFVEIHPDGQLGFASTQSGFVSLQQQCRAAKLC